MKRKRQDGYDGRIVKGRGTVNRSSGTINRAISNRTLIDAYEKSQETSVIPDISQIVKEKEELFAKQAINRDRPVNECKLGAMGPLTDKDGQACSYGILPPHQVAGLNGSEKIEAQDGISFHPIFAFPMEGELVTITAQVDGVIEQTIPRASVLQGEGVLYRVIPVRSTISHRTRERFNKDEDYRRTISTFTVRLLEKLHPGQDWKRISDPLRHLDQLIAQTYVPLKVNGVPLVYWLGLMNDLRSARVDITAATVDYQGLEDIVDRQLKDRLLGSFQVVEINYDRKAQKLMSEIK